MKLSNLIPPKKKKFQALGDIPLTPPIPDSSNGRKTASEAGSQGSSPWLGTVTLEQHISEYSFDVFTGALSFSLDDGPWRRGLHEARIEITGMPNTTKPWLLHLAKGGKIRVTVEAIE